MHTDQSILDRLLAMRGNDLPVHGGRTMAYVYDSGLAGLDDLAIKAQAVYAGVNGLDMTVFPSVVQLENDLVQAAADLLGGDDATVGTFTSGGTESCLLAVHTARAHMRATHDVTVPEMIVASTAHPAFHKAAELFGVTPITVPVDDDSYTVRAETIEAAITPNTALVVASAPSYAHGVIDPVADVAAVAERHNVLCHVDACIGGWYLGHLSKADDAPRVPPFGLDVPGVTSVSVDLHKYAYTPKGASIVLFRDAELRRSGWFVHTSWPGYPVITTTLQGTKSAATLAGAWAVVQRIGTAGYVELARAVHDATQTLIDGLGSIEGLRVLGRPQASLIAVASDDPEVVPFVLADEMRVRGWYLQPQLAFAASPANLHLTVTAAMAHPDTTAELLQQLAEATAQARQHDPVTVDPALAAAAASLDPEGLTPDVAAGILAAAGIDTSGVLPTRMAPVLTALQALPPRLAGRLLPEVIGRLFSPSG